MGREGREEHDRPFSFRLQCRNPAISGNLHKNINKMNEEWCCDKSNTKPKHKAQRNQYIKSNQNKTKIKNQNRTTKNQY